MDIESTNASRTRLEDLPIHTPEISDAQSRTLEWNFPNTPLSSCSAQTALSSTGTQSATHADFNYYSSVSVPTDTEVIAVQNYLIDCQLAAYTTGSFAISSISTPSMRYLQKRPELKTGAQMAANNMAKILCSYPKMILDYDNLPPFVHSQWVAASGFEGYLEPLGNCISLLGMLNTRARGSTSLFWRNVRMECDRLSSIYTTFSKEGAIAAIQALLLYMLVRVSEGETEHNNHDAALLGTFTLVLGALGRSRRCDALDEQSLELSYPGSNWSKWIFEESFRRVAAVFRLINMLVCVSPVPTCDSQPGLVIAPLPARKQLWAAASEQVWMSEVQRAPIANSGFGLAYSGDMIGLDEYQMKYSNMPGSMEPCTSSKSKENWEEWSTGMDGFGGLIMMAASLPVMV
jgi:hypothetical protein